MSEPTLREAAQADWRAAWIAHGGSFHGPNVETGTMPASKLEAFIAVLAASPAAPVAVEPVAEIIECPTMGQQTVREIDGRWRWLRVGDFLYADAPNPTQLQQAVERAREEGREQGRIEEREACALACEQVAARWSHHRVAPSAAHNCATAIRARGTTT